MRNWPVAFAILVGLATTAHAERIACAPSLGPPTERVPGDTVPPAMPIIRYASLTATTLLFAAELSADTVRLHITYEDPPGTKVELWALPDRTFVCIPPRVTAGSLMLSIAAVDATGNEAPVAAYVDIEHHHHCGHGFEVLALYLLGIPALAIGLLIAWLVRVASRRSKLAQPGMAVAPLVAERMTRAVINETLLTIALAFTLSMLLYFTEDHAWAAMVAYVPLTRLFHLARARSFLSYLEATVPAQLHDNVLAAASRHLVVPRRIVRDARHHGLPGAEVKVPRGSAATVDEASPKP